MSGHARDCKASRIEIVMPQQNGGTLDAREVVSS